MVLKINWKEPVIKESSVMRIQPSDLDDFYIVADNFDKTNLYFVLLTSFHHYLDKGAQEKAARLSFFNGILSIHNPNSAWFMGTCCALY